MLKSTYTRQNCSIARALEVVGERWTLLLVRDLMRRPRRFSELERSLGIAKNILANRLEKLVDVGIVETSPAAARGDWKTYALTPKGSDLFPVIATLMAWGDMHAAPGGPPVIIEHGCGQPAGHRLVCEHCGELLRIADLRFAAGPGLESRQVETAALPATATHSD